MADDYTKQFDNMAKASISSGRVGLPAGMPPTQHQQAAIKAEQPAYNTFSNIMAIPNITGGFGGAVLRDYAAGRPILGDQKQGAPTAEAHFFEMMHKKGPAAAVNEYFLTSPNTMQQLHKSGGAPLADYMVKHPIQNAVMDFVGRVLDAGNVLAGEGVRGAAGTAKAGATTAGRAAAKTVTKVAPKYAATAAGQSLVRHLNSAGELGSMSRFGEVRAAGDLHGGQGGGARAESHARDLANATGYAEGISQRMANRMGKGLTLAEQYEVQHMVEGDSDLWGKKLTPAQQALKTKLMPYYDKAKADLAKLDKDTEKYEVAGPHRLIRNNFFPRANELEQPNTPAYEQRFGKGSFGVRKGTLGENVHRRYATLKQALRAGEKLSDHSPMQVIEEHAYIRTQAARINRALDGFEQEGLIVPKQAPVPHSLGVTTPVPQPDGFIDSNNIGGLKSFGSSITRDAWVHPSVASILEDVGHQVQAHNFVASLAGAAGKIGQTANRLLTTAEVSNPGYHGTFNISENIASEVPNPVGMAKGLSKKAIAEAEQEGVTLPYARHHAAYKFGRPYSDLSPQEKLERVLLSPQHAVESVAAKPLYEQVEPPMASAAFQGLKGRLGAAQAKNAVRGMLGEPENIPAAAKGGAAQLLQFPAWTMSQLIRWPKALAQRPYLYNAPQALAADYNASRGRGRKPGDESKFFPPLVVGKDKYGDPTMLTIPHPGNRAAALMSAVANKDRSGIGYAAAGALNPLLQQPAYNFMQDLTSQQRKDLNDVKPAEGSIGQQIIDYAKGFAYFSPYRSFTKTELTPERAQKQKGIINSFLYGGYSRAIRRYEPGLVQLRSEQRKAQRDGDAVKAARLQKAGDTMYQRMVNRLATFGFPAP